MKIETVGGAGGKSVQVVVRVRPPNTREMEQNQRRIIKVVDGETLIFDPEEDEDEFFFHGAKQSNRDITKRINKKLSMEFDEVFDNDATNQDIFESSMKPLITSVMAGYNSSVFVYGATGAGKTFTMLGSEQQQIAGVTYLTVKNLFEQMEALSAERKFDIGISYLEVYNEQVRNLLEKSAPLKLREDANGVVVGGLCLVPIYNADELLSLLALGNRNRTQHPTDANAESSRSHAIFQVHIRIVNKLTSQKNTVKLSMIDLAGSERAASTKGMGIRFKEGANINKSLLALGNCINKLADGSKHIPYRDSNLTRIIKDSLGGNCQTLMIANVSPSSLTYEDTYNTLKYASRAKNIRSNLKLNVCKMDLPKNVMVKKLSDQQSEIEMLRKRVKDLEQALIDAKSETAAVAAKQINGTFSSNEIKIQTPPASPPPDYSEWYTRIDDVSTMVQQAMEQYYSAMSREKILKFRLKIKEGIDESTKLLTLDQIDVKNNRIEASIGKFSTQIERQTIEINRLRVQFHEKETYFKRLRREIGKLPILSGQLKPYLDCKEIEINRVKSDCKCHHLLKIFSLQQTEIDQLKRIQLESHKLLQNNYFLLSATSMSMTLREQFENIRRLSQRQHEVTFDEYRTTNVHKNPDDDLANLTIDAAGFLMINGNCNGGDESMLSGIYPTPITSTEVKDTTICLSKRTYDECSNDETATTETRLPSSTAGLMLPPAKKIYKENHLSSFTKPSNFNETITIDGVGIIDGPSATVTKYHSSSTAATGRMAGNNLKPKVNLMRKLELSDNNNAAAASKNLVMKMNPPKIKYPIKLTTNKENKKISNSPGRMGNKKSPKSKTPRQNIMLMRKKLARPISSTVTTDNLSASAKKRFKF